MSTLADPDSGFNANLHKEKKRFEPLSSDRKPIPYETRTYQVVCDICRMAIFLSGPHDSGSDKGKEAVVAADRFLNGHADQNHGHRTTLLMHTQNTMVSSYISPDETVRS